VGPGKADGPPLAGVPPTGVPPTGVPLAGVPGAGPPPAGGLLTVGLVSGATAAGRDVPPDRLDSDRVLRIGVATGSGVGLVVNPVGATPTASALRTM